MKTNHLTMVWRTLVRPKNISNENIAKLFHYTFDDRKEKIVGQDKVVFQLTRADKFLDKNEGFHILEPFYHACGDLYESKIIDEGFYRILRSIDSNDIASTFSGSWIFCFSKNGNSTFLKRRYAAGNGWILGISFDYLDDICIDFPEACGTMTLYEVEYSFNKILRAMKNAIRKYYIFYKQESKDFSNCKKEIIDWLSEYSLIYKSTDYKMEEEIRLICKFAPHFSSWKNEEHGVQLESSVSGYDANMKMIFNKTKLIYESQKLEICFDTKLNKSMLRGEEIRKVL